MTTHQECSLVHSPIQRNEPFVTKIGVGQVIKGWDEGIGGCRPWQWHVLIIIAGVPQLSKGEKALLTITSDYVSLDLMLYAVHNFLTIPIFRDMARKVLNSSVGQ